MRSIEDLLDVLIKATEQGRLVWEAKNSNSFKVQFSEYQIVVWDWTNPVNDSSGVTIRIVNAEGVGIDEISSDEFNSRYVRLKLLFDLARRSANRVDRVVADIEQALRSLTAA